MHVCQIIWNIDAIGGAERMVVNIARGLIKQGDTQVTVISIMGNGDSFYSRRIKEKNIRILHLFPHIKAYNPALTIKLLAAIKQLEPDILHSHIWGASMHAMVCAKILNLPHIVHEHNVLKGRKWYWNTMDKLFFRTRTKTIACSSTVKASITTTLKIKRATNAITILDNCLEEPEQLESEPRKNIRKEMQIPDDAFVIINVASLTEQKGQTYLIQAFAKITRDHPKAMLIIVGEGPLRAPLEREIEAFNLKDKITLMGLCSNISELLSGADAFVLPSLWEGLPMVILEAMYMKLPVAASHTGILGEMIIHKQNGLLSEPEDITTLAGNLRYLISNPHEIQAMGTAGYELVMKKYLMGNYIKKLMGIYRKCR